jgi:hypothetical protein
MGGAVGSMAMDGLGGGGGCGGGCGGGGAAGAEDPLTGDELSELLGKLQSYAHARAAGDTRPPAGVAVAQGAGKGAGVAVAVEQGPGPGPGPPPPGQGQFHQEPHQFRQQEQGSKGPLKKPAAVADCAAEQGGPWKGEGEGEGEGPLSLSSLSKEPQEAGAEHTPTHTSRRLLFESEEAPAGCC